MSTFKEIWVREADGSEYCAFTWTRSDTAGIARAKIDAALFGKDLVHVWVGRTFPSRESWAAYHAEHGESDVQS